MYKTLQKINDVQQSLMINENDFIPLNDVLKKKEYINEEQYKRLLKIKKDLVIQSINNWCDNRGLDKPELKRSD